MEERVGSLDKTFKYGNERVYGMEFLDKYIKQLLIMSLYIPTNGCHGLDWFKEILYQL